MTVAPFKFNRIVPHSANFFQYRPWNRVETELRPMSLTQCAWAVATQVLLLILPYMAVVPGNPDDSFSSSVVDFSREANAHGSNIDADLGEPRLGSGGVVSPRPLGTTDKNYSSTKCSPDAVMNPILVRLTKYVRGPRSGRLSSTASVTGINLVLVINSS